MSVRKKPFAKDSPTCQFVKDQSPNIRRRVSSPKTIRQGLISPKTVRQRFASVSNRKNPYNKNSPTCQFAKNHWTKIRKRVGLPKTINKDSPTCQFARDHSGKIRQWYQFAKDHSPEFRQPMSQFARDHSPKIRQPVSSLKTIRERFANGISSLRTIRQSFANQCLCSPGTIRQRFVNVSVRQKPLAKDLAICEFAKQYSPMIRQLHSSPKPFAKDSPTYQFGKDSPTFQFGNSDSS